MVFRRRFQVVMLGDSALTAAQRSVLSEHRSEGEAREAAAVERRRLDVVRPDDASSWTIQVLRDGEVVHEEPPGASASSALDDLFGPAAPEVGDTAAGETGTTVETPAPEPEEAPAEEPGPPAEEPGAAAAPAADEAPAAGPAPPGEDEEAPGAVAGDGTVAEEEPSAEEGDAAGAAPDERPEGPRWARAAEQEIEEPPDGPVPDWVIRRFEDSVARERRRDDGVGGEE